MHLIYSTCPIVYANKHLSCLTYGRVPTKRNNYVGKKYPERWMNINPSCFFFINQIFVSLHVHTINNLETVIHTVIVIDEEL